MHCRTATLLLSTALAAFTIAPLAAQSCDAARSRYDGASSADFPSKYDSDKHLKSWATKLPNRAYGDFTGIQIEATATGGDDATPASYVLTYTRTYVMSERLMSSMPKFRLTSKLHAIVDTTAIDVTAAAYDKGAPIIGIVRADLIRERLSFPLTNDQISAMAAARKIRFSVDKDDIEFDKKRLQRGAQAIVIGMACNWKE